MQNLIHASDNEDSNLLNDGDPLVFLQLLLESGEDSLLTIKDVGSVDGLRETGIYSLRQFCYNLPKYKLAQVSAELDKYLLFIKRIDSNWYVSFKKKSSVFEKSD